MERTLPHNIDAEQGVLASLMIEPDLLDSVSDLLRPEDFYRNAHQLIFRAMLDLRRKKMSIDSLTLCDELEQQGKLEDAGGVMCISTMYNYELHAGNIMQHAELVARDAALRRQLWAAGEIAKLAWTRDPQALEKAEQLILSIRRATSGSGFVDAPELMDDYMQELQFLRENKGALVGVPTGYTDLDDTLGGLQKGDLILLGGRPGSGKTSLGLCIGYHAALRGKRVAIFSLEMRKRQLARRLMAMESKIDLQQLRAGWLDDDEWEKAIDGVGKLSELPLSINDTSGNPLSAMRAQLRRFVHEKKRVDLVMVDYLGLILPEETDAQHYKNLVQQVSEISQGLKRMACEFDVPVLALVQLSRAVEQRASKIPVLSDLRDSGSLEQEADVVLLVYRDDYYAEQEHRERTRPNIADISIAKQRNGPVGAVSLYFEGSQTMFYNLQEDR
jgi:replicative DNA helicase